MIDSVTAAPHVHEQLGLEPFAGCTSMRLTVADYLHSIFYSFYKSIYTVQREREGERK